MARLDHFSAQINQQNQVISDNKVKFQSLVSSFDQFQLLSERQFLSLEDQFKVLSDAPGVERSLVYPSLPVRVLGVEQEEVLEGL